MAETERDRLLVFLTAELARAARTASVTEATPSAATTGCPAARPARKHDVGFTSLQLSEPALRVPGWQRPLVRMLGRVLARRFVRSYQRQAAATFRPGEVRWHQAVVCLRALVEVASWVQRGTADAHAGHPWLLNGPVFARRLASLTGASVRAR